MAPAAGKPDCTVHARAIKTCVCVRACIGASRRDEKKDERRRDPYPQERHGFTEADEGTGRADPLRCGRLRPGLVVVSGVLAGSALFVLALMLLHMGHLALLSFAAELLAETGAWVLAARDPAQAGNP
jgi:hypothetical protein